MPLLPFQTDLCRAGCAFLCLLWFAISSCTTDPTEILLFIDTDIPLDRVDRIEVDIVGRGIETIRSEPLNANSFPISIGVESESHSDQEQLFVVRAVNSAGSTVVEREAIVRFVPREVRFATVVLFEECEGMAAACMARQTCSRGECVSSEVQTMEWEAGRQPSPIGMNGGSDAGPDTPVPTDSGPLCVDANCWAGCDTTANRCREIDQLALGGKHTCALSGGQVFCWGSNSDGQLGTGGMDSSPAPRRVTGLLRDESIVKIAAGGFFTCAADDRKVWCWGENSRGQIARSNGPPEPSPMLITSDNGVRIAALGAGRDHACFARGNEVLCWGRDEENQVTGGMGSSSVNTATVVEALRGRAFEELGMGGAHSCGRDDENGVWCWGKLGFVGHPGVGAILIASPMTRLTVGGSDLGAIASQIRLLGSNCGLLNEGAAGEEWQCWGSNDFSELLGVPGPAATPTAIGNPGGAIPGTIENITLGCAHGCVVNDAESVYCYGFLEGDEGPAAQATPIEVPGAMSPALLRAGGDCTPDVGGHTCIVTSDQAEIRCWGNNSAGQIGQPAADTPRATEPMRVPGPQ